MGLTVFPANADDDGDEDEEDEETPMDGKKRIEDMSIDEFLNQSDFDDDDDDDDDDDEESDESEEEEDGDEEVSDEDDDDEEEEEVSDEDDDDDLKAIERANEKMGGEIRAHKEALGKLKETDPEFYEFLREEDSELLDFDEVSDDEDEDEDDLSDDEDDTTARKKAKKRTLTTEIVKKLCENAEGGESLAGAKALFQAYRSACHYGDDENDGDEASVRLASSSAFHELVQYTLTNADGILRGLLGVESRDDDDAFKPHANARWKKVQPLAKSYIGNTLHLLGNLTDAEMTAMVIRQLKTVTPFMATFERLTKRVTRSALHCFGSGEPSVRVQAILLLRAMAVGLPPPSLERVAKGVYRTFASNAKFLNAESVEHIVFMSTCVVEIFGLDQQQSYPLAFTYIRQLASLLRGALTAKSKEAFRNVYCWQYVNCLECWERVLSTHAKDEDAPLRPLVYPLAQVALGAARLLPSARYAPLRLRLVALLNRLSVSTGRFIPVAPLLMELLTFSELTKPPVSSKSHPPDFTIVLRLAKQDLRVPGVQDVIVESSMEALAEHLHQNAYSPAFPELAHIPTRELKKFCKTVSVTRFKKAAKAVIDAAERTSDWMIRKRDNVDFAPKDLDKVANFLAAERAEGKAPMSRLAKQLHEKAEQRVAAQQAVDVKLTRGQKASTGASDSEDEEHEEDTADDDDREDDVVGDEDDDEDDFAAKSDDDSDSDVVIDGDEAYAEHKKRKSRAGDHDSLQGDDDVVEDFQLSSSSDDDEEEDRSRRKKQSSSKKKRRQ
tara:strand:+ start:274 stop:2619 length:2346 start_codon:yes stop_codon:yes gene_type:complete